MNTLSFLDTENYRLYYIDLAHKLGSIHAAIFLSELINRRKYHKDEELLHYDGKCWFYLTHEKAFERLAMSRKEQDSAIKVLIKHGLIQKTQKGLPAKRYFWIDQEKVLELFGIKKESARLTETDKLECPNGTNWNDRKGQSHIYIKNTKEEERKNIKKESPQADIGFASEPRADALQPPPSPPPKSKSENCKETFGELKNVRLTREEHEKLVESLGDKVTDQMIDKLDLYVGSTGKKYKSHYCTILSWMKKEKYDEEKFLTKMPRNQKELEFQQRMRQSRDYREANPERLF